MVKREDRGVVVAISVILLVVALAYGFAGSGTGFSSGGGAGGGTGATGAAGPSGPTGPSGPAGTSSFDCQNWTMWCPNDKDFLNTDPNLMGPFSNVVAPTTVKGGCISDLNKTWPSSLTDAGVHVLVNMDYFNYCSLDYFGAPSGTTGTFGVLLQNYSGAGSIDISEITWASGAGDPNSCVTRGSVTATDLTAKTGVVPYGIKLRNQTAATSDIGLTCVSLRCCTGIYTP